MFVVILYYGLSLSFILYAIATVIFCPQNLTSYSSINSYNKTNEMHRFFKFIFGIELYMFRTVSLSIISSLALYTQQ